MARVRDTDAMIAGVAPQRRPGAFVFATLDGDPPADAVATILEGEGLSVVLPVETAAALGQPTDLPMAMITLTVNSALDGIGLSAAVTSALADAGIACNLVAGHHHDHVFVPLGDAENALARLRALAGEAP